MLCSDDIEFPKNNLKPNTPFHFFCLQIPSLYKIWINYLSLHKCTKFNGEKSTPKSLSKNCCRGSILVRGFWCHSLSAASRWVRSLYCALYRRTWHTDLSF